ncbi:hypothetical protein EDB19DRAFT_1824737 [Suillus lakei]|nr:hypothetical protein EDB19DRAFT_1824737 [Suillus lakei]
MSPPKGREKHRVGLQLEPDAVWHYNMHEHIFREHEEYMVLGQRDISVPLPISVWREMKLTDLEQMASRIPKTHWQPSYTPPGKIGKENVPLLVSRGSKCTGAQAGPSCPSKKA